MKKITVIISILAVFTFFLNSDLTGQEAPFSLRGNVYDSLERKPVDFATVMIVESMGKTYTDEKGFYEITVPSAGTYTLLIRVDGFQIVREQVVITGRNERTVLLRPITVKGGTITITGDRPVQKLSRRTMTVDEIKEVPASFGDSVNALTSLPGVVRSFGDFFGPLVIRGSDPGSNRYFVDEMPINNPLHFAGFHSVISNDLMSEIDLFSSSFPAMFSGATAAVISINTIDTVEKFGGSTDIGMISATTLISTPITRERVTEDGIEKENAGYFIASGRIGYLSLFVPIFYKLVMDETLESVPEYWDYQFKGKYFLNSRNSFTILAIGSADYFRVLVDEDDLKPEDGADPLFADLEFKYSQSFHNQGIYYTFDTGKFRNRVMAYSSWSDYYAYVDARSELAADWLKDYTIDVVPHIFGLKDSFTFLWPGGFGELKGALEATWYNFKAKGKYLVVDDVVIDPGDPLAAVAIPYDVNFLNTIIGGYIEQHFKAGGFKAVPSVRSEYLEGTDFYTLDPRILISYEFPAETTISYAGGKYSGFYQTNPFAFQFDPQFVSQADHIKPEKSWHNALGIEQIVGLYTVSVEGFYNYFYDQVHSYYSYELDGKDVRGINSGKRVSRGFEIMIKKDHRQGISDFFGWVSYTYNRSKSKSGLPTDFDLSGDKWINFVYEQQHALKLVAGYQHKRHTYSARFQLYSSFPYTEIIGSYESPTGMGRYAPEYDIANENAKHFPINHRLDLRYSYRTGYEWGHVSWYVEVINAYGPFRDAIVEQRWRYDKPYGDDNPKLAAEEGLTIIPNFGVEVKF